MTDPQPLWLTTSSIGVLAVLTVVTVKSRRNEKRNAEMSPELIDAGRSKLSLEYRQRMNQKRWLYRMRVLFTTGERAAKQESK